METQSQLLTKQLLGAFFKSKGEETPDLLNTELTDLLISEEGFIKKIKALDLINGKHKLPNDISELIFDILLFNFFSEDSKRLGEGYFDTKEWEQIEDAIIDRGTELLNLMLYLQECKDSAIEHSIDDYLDEYLISEDDFDNEDHEVYEAVIKNRELIATGDLATMISISKNNKNSLLNDQLLPILLFFETNNDLLKKQTMLMKEGSNPAFQCAFLAVLSSF